jgi:hypothetical protein
MSLEIGTKCTEIERRIDKDIDIPNSFYSGLETKYHRSIIDSNDSKRVYTGIVVYIAVDTESLSIDSDSHIGVSVDIVEEVYSSKYYQDNTE